MATQSKEIKKKITDNIDARQLINSASSIVMKAANILEENIAEGIIAAQKVEKKYVDTDKVRGNKDDVMNKFRKDTHEALDIIFDALTLATQSLQELTKKAENLQTTTSTSVASTAAHVPVLSVDEPIDPGSEALIPLTLENESQTDVMNLQFRDQGLSMDDQHTINSRNITYEPKKLTLNPGEKGVVQIRIHIPKTTKSGIYSGLVREQNLKGLEAILRLQVK